MLSLVGEVLVPPPGDVARRLNRVASISSGLTATLICPRTFSNASTTGKWPLMPPGWRPSRSRAAQPMRESKRPIGEGWPGVQAAGATEWHRHTFNNKNGWLRLLPWFILPDADSR